MYKINSDDSQVTTMISKQSKAI